MPVIDVYREYFHILNLKSSCGSYVILHQEFILKVYKLNIKDVMDQELAQVK